MAENLTEIRTEIDKVDEQMISLLAQRGDLVKQAATFKRTVTDVQAPQRVATVIEKVKVLAREKGADEKLVEKLYRNMITDFIALEQEMLKLE
ncbi:chorismate mutase [Lactococcus chungangensis CAU 28 = DSM 22330]|uniref:Chorismate mutase n=1 Tax=Pseudolactococcus chungangensis CAU 28 = DSM 22330 TaxID=1122154 RepID=A0A1K2HHE3_9LACT|nr:chorismate mutase [Lactococcus chungangensis]PCS02697.1 chorismate mutase [Lactococcus chungangensis CAU 28 = DSM 22330]SFZ75913.1 isochorismate pyruvate lyase [Lactococcus chungangensis CAU 28 = DSM 22330]